MRAIIAIYMFALAAAAVVAVAAVTYGSIGDRAVASTPAGDTECRRAVIERLGRFGRPDVRSAFYRAPGADQTKRGEILFADDARIPNAFGAAVRVGVMCLYDKQDNKVLLVEAVPS